MNVLEFHIFTVIEIVVLGGGLPERVPSRIYVCCVGGNRISCGKTQEGWKWKSIKSGLPIEFCVQVRTTHLKPTMNNGKWILLTVH